MAILFAILFSIGAGGCLDGVESTDSTGESGEVDPRDLVEVVDKSGTVAVFHQSYLLSDLSFADVESVTAADIQKLLEKTPYDGQRSWLADYKFGQVSFAKRLVEIGKEYNVNPLVLLATLQKESSVVSKTVKPKKAVLNKAMGCGCIDDGACYSGYSGFEKQLLCAGELLDTYTADLVEDGRTSTGWGPGLTKKVGDGFKILIGNRASAALYTYTPWVLKHKGGNWLFWNIYRKFAVAVDYDKGLVIPQNEGFIGGQCDIDSDCFFADGICDEGVCTMECEGACPDRVGPGFKPTSCEPAAGPGEPRMCGI